LISTVSENDKTADISRENDKFSLLKVRDLTGVI
jgi:hypothetical protein